jgi:4-amino-4-deoxy-L-arabinose transferase-like glycosyltransferase
MSRAYQATALLLAAAAFALRLNFLCRINPYPDELVSLLAVRAILASGLPVLPSGLFYEHGLLFSYLGALFGALLSFGQMQVRLPSLLLSTLSVPLLYAVGRRLFSAPTGLLAAAFLAMSPAAVEWGGRARMYALLQFLILVVVFTLSQGTLIKDRPAWRYLALAAFLGAVLTHFVAVTLVPPLIIGLLVAGAIVSLPDCGPWFRRQRVLPEIGALGIILLIAFLVKRMGQPKGIEPYHPLQEGPVQFLGSVLAIYTHLTLDWLPGMRSLAPFFIAPQALLPGLLALAGLVMLIYRLRRPLERRDAILFFLYLVLGITTLEMIAVVAPERRDDKYLFMLAPVLYLLAGEGLLRLLEAVLGRNTFSRRKRVSILAVFGVAIAASFLSLPALERAFAQRGGDYEAAFACVQKNWQEGDQVMAGTPAAAGLYLGWCDFYLMQDPGYAYRLLKKDERVVDRWMGAPWVGTVAEFNSLIDRPERLWLVVERWGLLREYYEPFLRAQIMARMDLVCQDQDLLVFVSALDRRYVSQEPRYTIEAVLGSQVKLLGYSLDTNYHVQDKSPEPCVRDPFSCIVTGETARVTLYWQAITPMKHDYDVFVHVYNAAGDLVLQADHRPLENIMPTSLWRPGEPVWETTHMVIPPDLPPGVYELRAGMYRLETMERLRTSSGSDVVTLGKLWVQASQ